MLKFPTMRIYDIESVLNGLPKGLARMTKMELFKDVLELSPFFYGMNISQSINSSSDPETDEDDISRGANSTAAEICAKFALLYKTEGNQMTTAGELPDAMYIVRSGMLAVMHNGKHTFIARPGDVVGEMALLGLSANGRRLRTSTCLTMCELVYFEKDDLDDLMGLEGFRLPLRRMLSQYMDGLAGHIMSFNHLGAVPDPWRTQDGNTKGWWDDFAFNNVPWRKIQLRLRDQEKGRAHLCSHINTCQA